MSDTILVTLVGAFLIVFVLTPWVEKLAIRVGAVDAPGERKVHLRLMPRLGGLSIYLGFTLALLLTQPLNRPILGLLLGGTLITLVGVADDIKGLSPRVKLLGQVLAAMALVVFDIQVKFVTNPFDGMISLGWLGIPVTLLWIIGMTNALNLIDGLDGLAAGTAAIAAVTIAVVAWMEGQTTAAVIALMLAVSVLGFLKYNFNPARIFMGDSGSMFLGFNLAALAVLSLTKSATVISLFVPVLILGIPILDTLFAIIRRFFNHQPIFAADKHHLHHCLLEMGLSHRQAVLLLYLVNICLGVSAVLLTRLTTDQSFMMLTVLAVLILLGANKIGVIRGVSLKRQQLQPSKERKDWFGA